MITLWISVATSLLLTSLTGAIMVILWYGIGLILERIGFANIVFELLKMVVVFFFLPIAFMVLKWYELEEWQGYLFSPTPAIANFVQIFLRLWAIGAIICFLFMILDVIWTKFKFRNAFPCELATQEVFRQLHGRMGLKKSRLQLVQSYHAKGPCTVGIWKVLVLWVYGSRG